jgi:hypothetical protein
VFPNVSKTGTGRAMWAGKKIRGMNEDAVEEEDESN